MKLLGISFSLVKKIAGTLNGILIQEGLGPWLGPLDSWSVVLETKRSQVWYMVWLPFPHHR